MRHSIRATIVAVTTIVATSVMAPAATAATAVEPSDSTSSAGQTQGWLCRLLKLC